MRIVAPRIPFIDRELIEIWPARDRVANHNRARGNVAEPLIVAIEKRNGATNGIEPRQQIARVK